eukprot:TRINITY_DN108505_c0_g1_i1.p1 TRINITY_DN108505_c0_g1~~TRINITY_DN108505_c0_g1_i1.p1  ORF type:complete len:499 (-),score=104.43 TRINITY_DN108505_c0_g1_i1:62-1558(-)
MRLLVEHHLSRPSRVAFALCVASAFLAFRVILPSALLSGTPLNLGDHLYPAACETDKLHCKRASSGSAMEELPGAKRARSMASLPVVLGTSSKWRRGLFQQHFPQYGSEFMSADIDEKAIRAERPEEMVVNIATAKAEALLPRLQGREVLLVCMDQVVSCDGVIREKPATAAEARTFLESYRQGKGASCINGMVVHNTATGKRVTAVDVSSLFWKPFPDEVVEQLIKKGDIFTCAGGFTVEAPELRPYLDRTDGSLDSIQGLPLKPLRGLLRRAVAPAATHVLFDMDGLLLDTESAYTVAQQAIVDRWNKKFTWELKAKMMGRKALDAAQILIDELGLGEEMSAADFVAEREKRLDLLFAESALLPGVERLIRHLSKHAVPMAVATSSHRRHFDLKTTLHKELFGLMHHIVTGDQVTKSKPDPEIFLHAARLFETAPPVESVLVFEDAPNGVEAGLAAGMQVCHVPDANLSHDLRGDAHCELMSLENFRPEEWGLPPF